MSGGAIAGIVLAGGRSRRMGRDKATLPLAGRALLAHAVERLRPQVGALAVNANGNPAALAALGLPVIADPVAGFAGPLAGILAGLGWAGGAGFTRMVTVACDSPFFPTDLAARLAAAQATPETVVLAASAGRVHPVFGLWPVAAVGALAAWLARGEDRSIRGFVAGLAVATVAFAIPPGRPDPFFNINTPDDLARAETLVDRA